MNGLRYRQVHLDFHTSQYIEDVGRDFDADAFADTLVKADVDSVTCFARCHHGWLYYPSQAHPELLHPHLQNHNLLLEQIAACHARGIKVPVYTPVRWDERIIREHPEWLCRDENGALVDMGRTPDPHFYYGICLNSGYRRFFKKHLADIIAVVTPEQLDGLFMDIVVQVECSCPACRALMQARGLDPKIRAERVAFAAVTLNEFRREISAFIRERAPTATIYYNDSNFDLTLKQSLAAYTHMEIESLPSGEWGYDHFPVIGRYAAGFGKEMLGMTGKFHSYWGDFHSLKNRAALEYECFLMLALGAGCSIGDQLHPWGRLSPATYELIGGVYHQVREKEAYCRGFRPVAEIAILTPQPGRNPLTDDKALPASVIGAVRLLQELAYQFTVIDEYDVFENYKLLVLPDEIAYSPGLMEKLERFTATGGKVLGTFQSVLTAAPDSPFFGLQKIRASAYSREFVLPNDVIGKALPAEPFVMYLPGLDVTAAPEAVLMEKTAPWFERAGRHFCSHQHAPTPEQTRSPEVVATAHTLYCGHPLFTLYRKAAPAWCKAMVQDMLAWLLPKKRFLHDGPASLQGILNQNSAGTEVLHLLHYIPEKKAELLYTIEDVIPLYQLTCQVYTKDRVPVRVRLVPQAQDIPYEVQAGYVTFQVPRISGHQMVELQYQEREDVFHE